MTENRTFSESLREARATTGMSQQKMADRMLIPKRTIEKWETGERTPPPYVQRFVLNELTEQEPDKPLTLDELREMRYGWVWVECEDPHLTFKAWAYVGQEKVHTLWEYQPDNLLGNVSLNFETYGKEWLAYRSRPTRG